MIGVNVYLVFAFSLYDIDTYHLLNVGMFSTSFDCWCKWEAREKVVYSFGCRLAYD